MLIINQVVQHNMDLFYIISTMQVSISMLSVHVQCLATSTSEVHVAGTVD